MAARLGISVNTVKNHIKSALAHFRNRMNGSSFLLCLLLSQFLN
ncbi:hypothetical protein ACFOWA_01125 [Pedobacter lithocola]|uniref:HTH luxR-type domain-containing protein n=1 Tax=Pedobacter lithocola TaxID=1908239 RepID=A0ABV8P7V1_9SPHI